MDKLEKIYNGVFLAMLILAVYILFYKYNEEKKMDLNNDNHISQDEIRQYVSNIMKEQSNQPNDFRSVVKSSISGAMRGAIMGLILNGVEGAVTSGLVMAVINPIISGIEHKL